MKPSTNLFKILLAISLFNWIYFGYLFYSVQNHPTSDKLIHIIRFFGELLTIPLMIFTVFTIVYSIVKMAQKREVKKALLLFIINTITTLFLVYSS